VNDHDETATVRALEAWRPAGIEPDWDDVLTRAGVSRSPVASRRAAGLAAVTGLAVVLLVPSFGVGSRLKDLIAGSRRPGLTLSATVGQADGSRAGTFFIRSSGGIFVATSGRRRRIVRPHFFSRRRPHPLVVTDFTWKLVIAGKQSALDARVERKGGPSGSRLVRRLCHPCASTESGRLSLNRGQVASLFAGDAVVVLRTTEGRARGVVRLGVPRRR
jgi:hypothetical protein